MTCVCNSCPRGKAATGWAVMGAPLHRWVRSAALVSYCWTFIAMVFLCWKSTVITVPCSLPPCFSTSFSSAVVPQQTVPGRSSASDRSAGSRWWVSNYTLSSGSRISAQNNISLDVILLKYVGIFAFFTCSMAVHDNFLFFAVKYNLCEILEYIRIYDFAGFCFYFKGTLDLILVWSRTVQYFFLVWNVVLSALLKNRILTWIFTRVQST